MPFWWRAIDRERGGVFNCFDNSGTRLISREKFTWSQGRFAWLSAVNLGCFITSLFGADASLGDGLYADITTPHGTAG